MARAIWQANDDESGIDFDESRDWYISEARAAIKAMQDVESAAVRTVAR